MESFGTKDCEIMESYDRKFEKFPSKDSELDVPPNELSESFDRKFEEFRWKDSELKESAIEISESFDRKIEEFRSKDSEDTVSGNESRVDGRSRPRSVKQIEAYKRNFHKGDTIELKLQELDDRMRHLQSLVLRLVRGR